MRLDVDICGKYEKEPIGEEGRAHMFVHYVLFDAKGPAEKAGFKKEPNRMLAASETSLSKLRKVSWFLFFFQNIKGEEKF